MATEAIVKQNDATLALAADAEQFVDKFDRSDLAIPFLQVLQSNSPQTQDGHPKVVDGARPGMLFNTMTKELYSGKDGIVLSAAHHAHVFIEWVVREAGGGFVKMYTAVEGAKLLRSTQKDDKNRDILPNGNQLVDTQQYMVVAQTPNGDLQPAIFSLVSTQLKKAREWNSRIDNLKRVREDGTKFKPPIFAMTYKVTTVFESNEKGSWYGVIIQPNGYVDQVEGGAELYGAAKALRLSVEQGSVNIEKSVEASTGDTADENLPF